MSLLVDIGIAALSVGANALLFSFMLGRKTQRFEDHIAALIKDIAKHEQRLDANDGKFHRHEGKLIQLTVAGAKTSTALMMKFSNPHPEPVFAEIARSYDRIHGGAEESANGAA